MNKYSVVTINFGNFLWSQQNLMNEDVKIVTINFGNFLESPPPDQRKLQVDGVEMFKFGFRLGLESISILNQSING